MIRVNKSLWFGTLLWVGTACASSATSKSGSYEVEVEPPKANAVVDGRLTGPMTAYDALTFVRAQQNNFDRCFENETLNTGGLPNASYTYALTIPPSGNTHNVVLQRASQKDKLALEECVRKELQGIEFPGYPGAALELQVRVAARSPDAAGTTVATIEQEQ